MVESRKKLRPLLIRLLNEGNLPGLEWQEEPIMTWRLPWKTKKKTLADDDDGIVLKKLAKTMWPQHDGNLSKCKELLRNALRSLNDIKLVEDDKSKLYKVYQFLEEKPRKTKKQVTSSAAEPINYEDTTGMPSISNNFRSRSPIMNISEVFNYDQTTSSSSDSQETCSSSQGSDFQSISNVNLFSINNLNHNHYENAQGCSNILDFQAVSDNDKTSFQNLNSCVNHLNFSTYENNTELNPYVNNQNLFGTNLIPIENIPTHLHENIPNLDNLINSENDTDHIEIDNMMDSSENNLPNIMHAGLMISNTHLENAPRVIPADIDQIINENLNPNQNKVGEVESKSVCYPTIHLQVKYGRHIMINKYVQDKFGICSSTCPVAEESKIVLPIPEDCVELKDNQKSIINDLLQQMKQGIVFSFKDNDIYAERLCKCRVISQSLDKKLNRRENTNIFDYQNDFQKNLKLYKNKQTRKPKDYVLLGLGGSSSSLATEEPVYPISIIICHLKAKKELEAIDDELWPDEAPDGSRSDSYDQILESLEKVKVN